MNRREALRTLAAGSAAGALAGGMAIMATPSAAEADATTPIERMSIELYGMHERDTSIMSDAESDTFFEQFRALLDRITSAEPQTPRDVALQWSADCLFGTSDNSDEFRARLFALAGIPQPIGSAA